MKRIQLALNLKGLDPSGIELYANTMYRALNTNTNFTGVATYLPALSTGISHLRSALISAQPGSLAIKKQVAYIKKVLVAIKGIVELECDDDEEKALSSGFTLKQNNGTRPKVFEARQGEVSGTVKLVCPYAGQYAAYVWELTTDISLATGWKEFKITNTASAQAAGLNPGTKYWFRVKAIVQDVEQPYSDPHLVHVV